LAICAKFDSLLPPDVGEGPAGMASGTNLISQKATWGQHRPPHLHLHGRAATK